jgi:serine/threonine protein phosphatase PrpC
MARVCGTLAISRAFGNFHLQTADNKRIIDATPHISSCAVEPGQVVIVACDGLWDVYSFADAIKDARGASVQDAATTLSNKAVEQKYSRDNVTTIVAFIAAKPDEPAPGCGETPPL